MVVLILVLMEDTLGGCRRQWQRVHGITVLILVLMEDTLGERRQLVIDKYIKS